MTLKITLKPGEQLYIGGARVSVDSATQTKLNIEGELPVVRERDYLPAAKAGTNARKLYHLLQHAYLNNSFEAVRDEYFRIVGLLVSTQPTTGPYIFAINSKLEDQKLYAALKEARSLVQFDEGQLVTDGDASKWEGF